MKITFIISSPNRVSVRQLFKWPNVTNNNSHSTSIFTDLNLYSASASPQKSNPFFHFTNSQK